MPDKNQWDLSKKIEYWKKWPDERDVLTKLFSPTEYRILETIRQFEMLDGLVTENLKAVDKIGKVEETFIRAEEEAGISALLKKYVMEQLDFLLAQGTVEAWMDIVIWYFLLNEKKFIVEDYWEFPALKVMMEVFREELKGFLEMGGAFQISVLSLHSMQELTDAYFRVIFLCRRLEYGIKPEEEIMVYIQKMKFSDVFIRGIIDAAQIYNKEKVVKAIEERCWKS